MERFTQWFTKNKKTPCSLYRVAYVKDGNLRPEYVTHIQGTSISDVENTFNGVVDMSTHDVLSIGIC